MYRIAIACEGTADRAMIEAVLDYYLDDYEPLPIQPPISNMGGDSGPFGGGWRGVKTWCEQEVAQQGGLSAAGIFPNADLLILQVDADIAYDSDIDCALPCPPAEDTVTEVENCLMCWLDVTDMPEHVVFCIPSLATEAWVLSALFPTVPEVCKQNASHCLECRDDAKSLLRTYGKRLSPKLVSSQGGSLRNNGRAYVTHQAKISQGWQHALQFCSQARRFESALKGCLEDTTDRA